MSRRIEKWRSSETKWSAFATNAQSAYLLSSGSLCINPHSKYMDCNEQFSSERRSFTTLSATEGEAYSANFSWYSDKISLLRINSNLPPFKESKIGRYFDVTGREISRTFISSTTLIEQRNYANAHFSSSRWSAHSTLFLAITDPFRCQFAGQNNQPAKVEFPLTLLQKRYKDTTSVIPFEDCSICGYGLRGCHSVILFYKYNIKLT